MKEEKIYHYSIEVKGRVQGVGFRYSAINAAERYGVKGFVKNLYNRNVYLEIEGTLESTELMKSWCHEGPGTARVDEVYISEGTVVGFTTFSVKY